MTLLVHKSRLRVHTYARVSCMPPMQLDRLQDGPMPSIAAMQLALLGRSIANAQAEPCRQRDP